MQHGHCVPEGDAGAVLGACIPARRRGWNRGGRVSRPGWLVAAGILSFSLSLTLALTLALAYSVRTEEDRAVAVVEAQRAEAPFCLAVDATEMVSQLTGAGSAARTDERWNVTGTDLGFTFEHEGVTYMVFGDTWGRDGVEGSDWRSNTMAVVEQDPVYGLVITEMVTGPDGTAKELLRSLKQPKTEYTVIPNTGIAVDDRLYLHYMSINDWQATDWGYKQPIVNGAGLAYSDDRGQNWVKDQRAVWSGDSGFSQAAMIEHEGHVYMFGTPAGRFGAARLLRAPSEHLLNPEHYEYWSGDGWSATPGGVAVVSAPVGELSVRWSSHHQRWLMMYLNDVTHEIVLRTAERLEGPWDEERVVVTAAEYASLYAPFMLPQIDGPEIYFTMSIYDNAYQVFLMKMTLDRC